MPLSGTYEWSQKNDLIKIKVPIKGISPSRVDIQVTVSTLKVNYAPYIIDIVLSNEIDSLKHKAAVKDGVLIITIYKKAPGSWTSLEADGDKDSLIEIKKKSSLNQLKIEEDLSAKRTEKKIADERHAVRKQMAIDELERNKLENLKLEEKLDAEKAVYETFARLDYEDAKKTSKKAHTVSFSPQLECTTVTHSKSTEERAVAKKSIFDDIDHLLDEDDIDDEVEYSSPSLTTKPDRVGTSEKTIGFTKTKSEVDDEEGEEEEVRFVPPPRSVGLSSSSESKVNISFTPRVFPTPMRESKASEEEDWIAKNRRHLKKHGVISKQMPGGGDFTEEDPVWLKAKGDDFFRSGDIQSALNAYSAAIDADEKMLQCYSNRAACFLKLGMHSECMFDCSKSLDLLCDEQCNEPKSNQGIMRIKLFMRRGTAACAMVIERRTFMKRIGKFADSLIDYHQANTQYMSLSGAELSKLNGVTVESLQEDIARLKKLHDANALKDEADALLADSFKEKSLEKYNEALIMVPVHVSCLSNRSACKLSMGDFEGCVEDCSLAMKLLQNDTKQRLLSEFNDGAVFMLNAILPAVGTEKRVTWTVKTLMRRGVAQRLLCRLDDAIQDFSQACALDPTNESLKADLSKLIIMKESSKVQQQRQRQQ